jgi:hypothetical protein
VDPLRGNYPEDAESRRYRGGGEQYPDHEGQNWFDGRPDEGYRQPDRRSAGRTYGPQPGTTGQFGPPVVEQRPPHQGETHWDPSTTGTQPAATGQTRRSRSAAPSPGGRSIGRPAAGLLLAIAVVVAEVPAVRLLVASAFGSSLAAGGLVAGLLVMIGLPLGALGLHGLTSGAARAGGPSAWLRPPVAYLTVALVLFVAAGLAA